jgi:hypothetical protein
MAKYNAFYHVEFYGAILAPRAAWQMDRPSNEVWLTEYFRPYEEYTLYHELNELECRAQ